MPYREVPVSVKVSAVLDHIRGLRPAEIERKYRVDRDSVRWWVKKAMAAITGALTPKPGRNPAMKAESDGAVSPISQKREVPEAPEVIPLSPPPAPQVHCPLCGGGRLIRNGGFPSGGKRLPLQRVQRWRCRDCGSHLYQPKKNGSQAGSAPGLSKRKRPAAAANEHPDTSPS